MQPLVIIAYNEFADAALEQAELNVIGAQVIRTGTLSTGEAQALAVQADAIVVSIQPVTSELIASLEHCKIIARCGTGLDNINIPAATARGIWVTNIPDAYAEEVSTHALALLLACSRRLIPLIEATREGRWERDFVLPFGRLKGQTLGLLGLGYIAQDMAQKGRALGLRVIAHDPYVDGEVFAALQVQSVGWEELLRNSDYVSLHTPLTQETNQMIDSDALALMKPSAFLINTARGKIIDEQALLEAVRSRRIAGAALDVLSAEPPPPDHPLLHEERILVTPHSAWYSAEATRDVRVRASQEVARVLRGENPYHPANRPERLKT
jgi:D-3-phosphoglycerate dehydrogenase